MTAAELVVKISADIHDLTAKLAEAGVEIKGFADDVETSSGRSDRALKDTEKSMNGLDKASQDVRNSMNGHGPGLFGALGEVIGGVLKLGSVVQDGSRSFGLWLTQMDQGETAVSGFGLALAQAAPVLGYVSAGAAALGIVLGAIPALAGAAMAVLTALADTAGTVGFFFYAALGPVSLLIGLLGLLGGGFLLAGERAIKGGGIFKDLASTVGKVVGSFHDLIYTLGGDFLPLFDRLASAAQTALGYLNHIAQLPLAQAFHSLATTGMAMLTKFLTEVGHALAQPFRLAVQLAFGGPGGRANNEIHGMMNQLGGFLFGTTGTATAHRGAAKGAVVNQGDIAGALAPIRKWFDDLNLTKEGKRWGKEIMSGLEDSGIGGSLGKWIVSVLGDAAKQGGIAFVKALGWEVMSAIPRLENWIINEFVSMFGKLYSGWVAWSNRTATQLEQAIGQAWTSIKGKAQSIWNEIVSFIERPLSVHINWPGVPSAISKALGFAGSVVHGIASHAAAGGIFTRPTHRLIGESGAEAVIPLTGGMGRNVLGAMGGGGSVVVNINNPTFMSGGRPAARELARILKPELDRIVRVG